MGSVRQYLAASAGGAGVTLAVGAQMAGEASPLGQFGTGASVIAFCAIPFLLARRRAAKEPEAVKPVPRTLARDALNEPSLNLELPTRIDLAIELSKQHSRTFGVLCFRLGSPKRTSPSIDAACEAAVQNLGKHLRKTDRALVSAHGEILVLLPLLDVRRDLESIAARLSRVVSDAIAQPIIAGDIRAEDLDLGIAMHPIDGYGGVDLIEAAQGQCAGARAERLGERRRAQPSTGPMPIRPPAAPSKRRSLSRTPKKQPIAALPN